MEVAMEEDMDEKKRDVFKEDEPMKYIGGYGPIVTMEGINGCHGLIGKTHSSLCSNHCGSSICHGHIGHGLCGCTTHIAHHSHNSVHHPVHHYRVHHPIHHVHHDYHDVVHDVHHPIHVIQHNHCHRGCSCRCTLRNNIIKKCVFAGSTCQGGTHFLTGYNSLSNGQSMECGGSTLPGNSCRCGCGCHSHEGHGVCGCTTHIAHHSHDLVNHPIHHYRVHHPIHHVHHDYHDVVHDVHQPMHVVQHDCGHRECSRNMHCNCKRFCVPVGYHGGYGWPYWHGYPGVGTGLWGWGWPWIKNKVPKKNEADASENQKSNNISGLNVAGQEEANDTISHMSEEGGKSDRKAGHYQALKKALSNSDLNATSGTKNNVDQKENENATFSVNQLTNKIVSSYANPEVTNESELALTSKQINSFVTSKIDKELTLGNPSFQDDDDTNKKPDSDSIKRYITKQFSNKKDSKSKNKSLATIHANEKLSSGDPILTSTTNTLLQNDITHKEDSLVPNDAGAPYGHPVTLSAFKTVGYQGHANITSNPVSEFGGGILKKRAY